MDTLKVSSKSNPVSVAGAIAGIIREKGCVEVQGIGAGAVNQALKSVAVARGYLTPGGVDLVCIPAFTAVEINGESKTAMKLLVEIRK
jgi:stage V sporulation protein S